MITLDGDLQYAHSTNGAPCSGISDAAIALRVTGGAKTPRAGTAVEALALKSAPRAKPWLPIQIEGLPGKTALHAPDSRAVACHHQTDACWCSTIFPI